MLRERPDRFEDFGFCLLHLGPFRGRRATGGDGRHNVERSRRRSSGSEQPIAVLEHDAAKPPGERRGLAQTRQAAIRLYERLLRRVLRQVKVAQDRIRIAKGHVLESPDDLAVSVQIARPGGGDQGLQILHGESNPTIGEREHVSPTTSSR